MTTFQKATMILIFTFCGIGVFAQNELNPYKYIIVPKKFEFLKEENQYRVNSYVKHLFVKEGYTVYYLGDDYPEDLSADPCLAVTAGIEDGSNAFTTKLVLLLKNCAGETVFQTVEGMSKVKQYDKTYIDALNKCFVSVKALDYTYDPDVSPSPSKTVVAKKNTMVPKAAVPVAVSSPANVPAAQQPAQAASTTASAVPEMVNESSKTPEVVVSAPVVVAKKPTPEPKAEMATEVVAKSYQNENITFLLINQGAQLQAYITKSKVAQYKVGEMVGTFEKTSLPNVFRVAWKEPERGVGQTTAYFDDAGNLKIDVQRNGQLEVLTFIEVGK